MTLTIFLILALFALSIVAGLLRRLPLLAGLTAALGLAWLGLGLWRAPLEGSSEMLGRALMLDHPHNLLGFSFQLSPASRAPILLILLWGAIFAITAALARTERILYPAIPALLAALVIFLVSAPLLWAPLWLMLVAVVMAFIAQGNKPRPARAALRVLLAPILAFPFFLFAAWVFSQSAVAAEDPRLWNNAWKALIVGMVILTSPIPLHGWIVALGESAPPFSGAFLVGVWQIAIYAFLRRLLFSFPAITNFVDPGLWLPWIAVAQMLWAGAFMFGSQRLGQLWGYLLLWVYGAAFLAWGVTGELGSQAIIWLFLAAPVALALPATGLQSIVHRFGENPAYDKLHGVSERMPFSALAFIAGGLALLGWPLGALFPMRMATYQVTAFRAGDIFLWAMLALTLATLGLIRAARHLAAPLQQPDLERESRLTTYAAGLLLAAGGLIALNPGLITPFAQKILTWLNML